LFKVAPVKSSQLISYELVKNIAHKPNHPIQ